jgi:hypothetical protein
MSAEPEKRPDPAVSDDDVDQADPSDSPFEDPPLQEIERGLTDWRGRPARDA